MVAEAMVVECMRSSEKRAPERPLQKRGCGNPNMQLQHAGYSINPGGRRKHDKGAKELMGEVTVEMVEFWIATVRDTSEEMSHRMRASENIAWGFLGKPAQQCSPHMRTSTSATTFRRMPTSWTGSRISMPQ